jgi:hypothetical protein
VEPQRASLEEIFLREIGQNSSPPIQAATKPAEADRVVEEVRG